jgi:hypothetical protein
VGNVTVMTCDAPAAITPFVGDNHTSANVHDRVNGALNRPLLVMVNVSEVLPQYANSLADFNTNAPVRLSSHNEVSASAAY